MNSFLKYISYLQKDQNSFKEFSGRLLPLQKEKQVCLFCLSLKRAGFTLLISLFALFYSLPLRAQVVPTDGPGGPILVLSNTANPFSRYYAEILRAEGFNAFAVKDISQVTATDLSNYNVIVLGEMSLSFSQVTMLTDWVNGGGILIAMRPDVQLTSLLGITSANSTLSNKYLLVNTSTDQGKGIVSQTIQYHGAANLYTLSGATSVATLYSGANTPTNNPAVTINKVGSNGGQAVAFAYDLARSVVYTRQGNPAWAGKERDGQTPIRSDDLYYGNASNDPQADWVDLNKVAIPQADEQQHLLTNIIIKGSINKMPMPRFWFLPKGAKAAIVMTGDDHANGGTAGRFNQYKSLSPSNTADAVADWTAIRSTSYIYPGTPITDAQVRAFQADGFEIGLHLYTDCADWTPSIWQNKFSTQMQQLKNQLPGLAAVTTHRIHCLVWSDWASEPKMEFNNGIRLDVNYYYWPDSWLQNRSGMFTGSGMPMRFADLDGAMIDCYQVPTQMTDESGQVYPGFVDQLLDNATGTLGYYGVFCANMHTDNVQSSGSDAIVSSALSHNVPVISAKQMLTWLDGRNNATFNSMSWNNNQFSFAVSAGSAARNLVAMLPMNTTALRLQSITANGAALSFSVQTIKGIEYAFFSAATGNYIATYITNPCSTPPTATLSATAADCGHIALKLISASGTAPYSVVVNNTTYTNVTVGATFATVPATSTEQSIWGSTANPQILNDNDGQSVEAGIKFRAAQSGTVNGIRFYKGSLNTGTHTASLWTSTNNTKLATATFVNETGSGWQEVRFTNPVPVQANTTYIASYYSPKGYYCSSDGYFINTGVTNGLLTALQSGAAGGNGVYKFGTSGYPNQSYNGSNYWVDVLFSSGSGGSYTYTLTGITDANGCSSTGTLSTATVTQSDLQAAGQQVFYQDNDKDGYGNPNVTFQGCTAPGGYVAQAGDCNDNDAAVHAPVTYYRDVDADGFGDANTTTVVCQSVPPQGYVTNSSDCNDTQKLYQDSDGDSYGSSTLVACSGVTNNSDCDDTKAAVHPGVAEICGNGIDDNCNASVDEGCTVTTTYYLDNDKDGYGNPNVSTTATAPPTGYVINNTDCNDGDNTIYPGAPELCDSKDNNCNGTTDEGCTVTTAISIWGSSGTPQTPNDNDGKAIGVGVKFRAAQSGSILGVRFYKGAQNTGTHTASLWIKTGTNAGTKLATATFVNETGSGWQEVRFTNPVPIQANTTYVASYYSSKGGYASDDGFFNTAGVTNGALTALKSGDDGGNGVYIYGSGYPNKSYNGTNYWVDVVFQSNAAVSKAPATTTTTTAAGKLEVSAVPNPSSSYFTLQLHSAAREPVSVRIIDALGRVVETRRGVAPNSTLTIGHNYYPGVYYVQLLQGNHKTMVKLVKLQQ